MAMGYSERSVLRSSGKALSRTGPAKRALLRLRSARPLGEALLDQGPEIVPCVHALSLSVFLSVLHVGSVKGGR